MLLTFVRPADSLFTLQNENAVYRQRLCVCMVFTSTDRIDWVILYLCLQRKYLVLLPLSQSALS